MNKLSRLLKNRDFIFLLAFILGLVASEGSEYTRAIIIPALAVVMTLSTMGIPSSILLSPKKNIGSMLFGVIMTYGVLGSSIILLSHLLISNQSLLVGFIIAASVPPAIAIIPFTGFLDGNESFSLLSVIGGFLSALIVMPLVVLVFLGANIIDPYKILVVIFELIVIPILLSRILIRIGADKKIEPIKGMITNWSFFMVFYTIVGVNKKIIVSEPLSLLPAASIGFATTFALGFAILLVSRIFKIAQKNTTSLILLGTMKNYGLSAGLTMTLLGNIEALPSAVLTVFLIVYFIWLSFLKRRGWLNFKA